MSANSEWLKAYEAQKSKALEQLSAAKSDAGLIHSNSPGLSGPFKERRVFNSWAYTSPSPGNGKICNWSNVPIKTEVIQEDVTTPKIEADIKPKVEPCDEISNVNTRAEIQKWINQIEFKIEADVKPKIEVDIKPKIEKSDENEEINNGMEVISSMNFPVAAEIQEETLKDYFCFICSKDFKFFTKKLLIQHMRTFHEKNIKKKKKCNNYGGPNCGQRFSGLSILQKISHMMECYQKQQEEKYGCVFCPGLNFSSEPTLLNHISIVHGGEGHMSGPLSNPGWSGPKNGPMFSPIIGPMSGPIISPLSGPGWSGPMSGPMSSPGWNGPMSGPDWSGPMSGPGSGPMSGLRNGPKNYECSLCGMAKNLTSENILIQHMVKAHESKLRKKQWCFRCGEIYGERSVIEKVKHIIDAHQEQYQNEERECHICKKKFLGKTFFSHLKGHKLKKKK